MKTKHELEKDITDVTNKIQVEFPELLKYINEMPIKDSDEEEINNKNLEDYYNSLKGLLNKYAQTHVEKTVQDNVEKTESPGYKAFPASEDIY